MNQPDPLCKECQVDRAEGILRLHYRQFAYLGWGGGVLLVQHITGMEAGAAVALAVRRNPQVFRSLLSLN
jgi:hypothetical protein